MTTRRSPGNRFKTLAHVYVQARVLGEPPVPPEGMRRVIERMRRMSHGQAPDLDVDGVNETPRARRRRGVRRPGAAG